jgi:hypothetical protein
MALKLEKALEKSSLMRFKVVAQRSVADRVTRRVCKKVAQNVAQPIYLPKFLPLKKVAKKIGLLL